MANTVIKQCLVCGADYPACSYCENQNEFYAWRSVVCKYEHMAYHIPIISYARKVISKEESFKELSNAEKVYGEIEYADNIKELVNEIKSVSKTMKKKSVKSKAKDSTSDIDESESITEE